MALIVYETVYVSINLLVVDAIFRENLLRNLGFEPYENGSKPRWWLRPTPIT